MNPASNNPADAFARVLEVLDQMEVAYLVGGSVASSIHGTSRPTMNLDLVVDLRLDQVTELARLLQPDFYAHAEMMREAITRGRSFNWIHYGSSFKIDLFPLRQDAYSRTAFARRRFEHSRTFGPKSIECSVASPEDMVLRKLEWYRTGGETSERQWNDLRGIVTVNGAILDVAYLKKWAVELKVGDLLERLLAHEGQ